MAFRAWPRMMAIRASSLALLAVLLAACGSLNDEPRIVSTLPPRLASPSTTNQTVNVNAEGARLFSERCTPCHGDGGHGDGPLVRAGQIAAPPDFTQPATMTVQGFDAIFDTITGGRIEKMMPPWEGALSEDERRAVAEFVIQLGGGPEAATAPTEATERGGS